MGERLVDPARRVRLERVHEIRNRETRSQRHVQVHVIRRSTGTEQDRPLASRDARQTSIQTFLPRAVDPQLAAVGTPDEMDPHPNERMTHGATLVPVEVWAPSFPRGTVHTIARRTWPRPSGRGSGVGPPVRAGLMASGANGARSSMK